MRHIAFHSFKILLREKIMFNAFGITILLLFFGYLASQLVYGHQDRVMLDAGLMMNAFSIFAVSIGIGSRFLRKEIETKTIYLLIARPVTRVSFYLGRFLGMGLFLALNFFILNLILYAALALMSGQVSAAFFQSVFLTFLESIILLSASLLLSFWVRPALVLMIMLFLVFVGHNHEVIQSLQSGVSLISHLTPNFSVLLMSDRVYYGLALSAGEFCTALLYGLIWILFFILIGNAVFSRKNL